MYDRPCITFLNIGSNDTDLQFLMHCFPYFMWTENTFVFFYSKEELRNSVQETKPLCESLYINLSQNFNMRIQYWKVDSLGANSGGFPKS